MVKVVDVGVAVVFFDIVFDIVFALLLMFLLLKVLFTMLVVVVTNSLGYTTKTYHFYLRRLSSSLF